MRANQGSMFTRRRPVTVAAAPVASAAASSRPVRSGKTRA